MSLNCKDVNLDVRVRIRNVPSFVGREYVGTICLNRRFLEKRRSYYQGVLEEHLLNDLRNIIYTKFK